MVALVDAGDAALVLQYSWRAAPRYHRCYVQGSVGGRSVYLHRFLLQPPPEFVVDHVDGDGLNNRRGNLRVCTDTQNKWNRHKSHGRSRFRGVYWNAVREKWCAQIRDGKTLYLGLFESEIDAAAAYQDVEMNDGIWRIRTVGKGSKTHVIGVVPELQAAFKGFSFTGVYLFGYEDGTPWKRRAVERRVTLWGLAADVKPCTPHRFRHTLATMLLERGVPIAHISKLLGHADISTTMIYTEVSSQSLDAALMTLSAPPAKE